MLSSISQEILFLTLHSPEGASQEEEAELKEAVEFMAQKHKNKYPEDSVQKVVFDLVKYGTPELPVKSFSKVIIVGHGCIEKGTLAGRDAEWISEIIYEDLEIKTNKITLFSCDLGATPFPSELKKELLAVSDNQFNPTISAYTKPILAFSTGERMHDRGEDDESDDIEFIPARQFKKQF